MRVHRWPPPPDNPDGKALVMLDPERDEDAVLLEQLVAAGIIVPDASFAQIKASVQTGAKAERDCEGLAALPVADPAGASPLVGGVPPVMRPFRKLLRAVAELHVRGYQRVRIVPSLYDLGTWRCNILPACYVSKEHGARWVSRVPDEAIARYSSASGSTYWGWQDMAHATPGKLADVILERFPRIGELGYGQDWTYAGWYLHMLHLTYPDALPISWNDQAADGDFQHFMRTIGREITIPLPPPGHATEE